MHHTRTFNQPATQRPASPPSVLQHLTAGRQLSCTAPAEHGASLPSRPPGRHSLKALFLLKSRRRSVLDFPEKVTKQKKILTLVPTTVRSSCARSASCCCIMLCCSCSSPALLRSAVASVSRPPPAAAAMLLLLPPPALPPPSSVLRCARAPGWSPRLSDCEGWAAGGRGIF